MQLLTVVVSLCAKAEHKGQMHGETKAFESPFEPVTESTHKRSRILLGYGKVTGPWESVRGATANTSKLCIWRSLPARVFMHYAESLLRVVENLEHKFSPCEVQGGCLSICL